MKNEPDKFITFLVIVCGMLIFGVLWYGIIDYALAVFDRFHGK